MTQLEDVRRLALSLPETVEADHHGFPSFRVAKRIFATAPDATHVHLMLGTQETAQALAADPAGCEELTWGQRLAGVRVDLERADGQVLRDFLVEAWRGKAPRRALETFEGRAK